MTLSNMPLSFQQKFHLKKKQAVSRPTPLTWRTARIPFTLEEKFDAPCFLYEKKDTYNCDTRKTSRQL